MYHTFDRALAWAVSVHHLFPCFSLKVLGSNSSKAAATHYMLLGNCEQGDKSCIFTSALCIKTACIFHICHQTDVCNFKCKSACAILNFMQTVYIKLATCINKYSTPCLVCMSAECSYTKIFLKVSVLYAHCLKSLSVSGGQRDCCQHSKKSL